MYLARWYYLVIRLRTLSISKWWSLAGRSGHEVVRWHLQTMYINRSAGWEALIGTSRVYLWWELRRSKLWSIGSNPSLSISKWWSLVDRTAEVGRWLLQNMYINRLVGSKALIHATRVYLWRRLWRSKLWNCSAKLLRQGLLKIYYLDHKDM